MLSIIYKKEKQKIIAYQTKTFENPNTVNIKSIITEHPKTLYELFKTIKQAEKTGSNSSLYSRAKKRENFLNEKNIKITKPEHSFKSFASTYNVEILISFNPEL